MRDELEAMPRPLARCLLGELGRDGAAIRSVSSGIQSRLAAIAGDALPGMFVAPMPLDADQLARARQGARRLRAQHGDRLHLVVTRLVASKRIERAIDRVAGSGVPLVLIGEGPSRARLMRHARRRGVEVRALGALSHDRTLEWIAAAARVFLPLAEGEGAPTVMREAEALDVAVEVLGPPLTHRSRQ